MMRIAVVGGGPGGLFTARLLEEKHKGFCQITLFEAACRTGGKIFTRQFDAAPVCYEAGVAELYNYAEVGPDPLLQLVENLGLKTAPMDGQAVILNGRILNNPEDIQRSCGAATWNAIRGFRARCGEALPLGAWYEGDCHYDNAH